jgi:hypothetical protein
MGNDGKVYWTGELTGRQLSGYPYRPSNGKYFTQAERDARGGGGEDNDPTRGGTGTGTGGATNPQGFSWSFPQYSQSWAFTPPNPSPYMNPPKFDPKSSTGYLGVGSTSDKDKKNKTSMSSASMSLMDLWKRYGVT